MVKVRRANVVLKIKDFELKRYLDMGYNQIDETGKVIQEAIPTDVNTLKKAYVDMKKRIAELETLLAEKTKPVKVEPVQKPKKKADTQ